MQLCCSCLSLKYTATNPLHHSFCRDNVESLQALIHLFQRQCYNYADTIAGWQACCAGDPVKAAAIGSVATRLTPSRDVVKDSLVVFYSQFFPVDTYTDSSVTVSPSYVQHALRSLHMLKTKCPPFNKTRSCSWWHGNTQVTHSGLSLIHI